MKIISIIFFLLLIPNLCFAKSGYNRDDFQFNTYKPYTYTGWYTGEPCNQIDIDHVVSLKDAYNSGAYKWSNKEKKRFANDRLNHVSSCASVNRSKGASTPSSVIRKSKDGRGIEFDFINLCSYLKKYHKVKTKYDLSFTNNEKNIFRQCGISFISTIKPIKQAVHPESNSGQYHGNSKSHIYHGPSCRYYNCKNCTVIFSSKKEAEDAGYRMCSKG